MIAEFWKSLGSRERASLVVLLLALLAALGAGGWWLLRPEYQVVFGELSPADSAVMAGELERLKIPYRLDDTGSAILVERDQVHKTRIKLMGRDLPLHGAVGFELFNQTDFGMTEFAQRVNYQRALQGELTRTVLALSEIQDARVHLVLPEQGLFRRERGNAKASITVTLKPGRTLQGEQVRGIQRLVAASVPGIGVQDVTVLDQRGVALTRANDAAEPGEGGAGGLPSSAQLDLKKETEAHLARKAGEVLERAFGRGQALVSVDVVLDRDQVRTTTEDVLGAPGNACMAGVITREREVNPDTAAPLDRATDGGRRGASQRDVDYAVGRRVEQSVSTPGGVRRMQVVAVVSQALSADRIEPVRELVAAAVGASRERGDTVVVYSLAGASLPAGPGAATVSAGRSGAAAESVASALSDAAERSGPAVPGARPTFSAHDDAADWGRLGPVLADPLHRILLGLAGAGLLAVLGAFAIRRSRLSVRPLDAAQREARLAEVRQWLAASPQPVARLDDGGQA